MDNQIITPDQQLNEVIPIQTPQQPSSKSNLPIILFVIILLFFFGFGGIFLGKQIYSPKIITINSTINPTIILSPSLTPTIFPTTNTDFSTNWKTYINNQAKFSIKYPAEWKEKTHPSSGLPIFYSSDEKINLYYNFGPKGGMAMRDTIDNFCSNRHMNKISKLTLDNLPAVYCQDLTLEPNKILNQVLVQKDDFQIEINSEITKEASEDNLKLFDQILSTFKFTDQTQSNGITNWKTYTNSNYNFEFKYPINAIITEDNNQKVKQFILNVKNPDFIIDIQEIQPNMSEHYLGLQATGVISGSIIWDILSSTGYCDAGSCGSPFIAYETKQGNKRYVVIFFGSQKETPFQQQILPTFKFTQ